MTRFTSSAIMTPPVRYAGRRVLRRGSVYAGAKTRERQRQNGIPEIATKAL
jgi:hypothetical protein